MTDYKQVLRSEPFAFRAHLKSPSVVKESNAKTGKVAVPQQQCNGVLLISLDDALR